MHRFARFALALRHAPVLVLGMATLGACGGDKPPPYIAGGGDRDAGGGGSDVDSGPRRPPTKPKDAGGGPGGADSGGTGAQDAGDGGGTRTDAGPGVDSGMSPINLPDSPKNPWVAFVKVDGSGFGQLFFVKADGTGLGEYAGDSFSESDPAWSPDGTRLAFTALDLTTGSSLVVLNFDTGKQRVLNTGLAGVGRPRWTTDGKTIVVAGSDTAGGTNVLYRVDLATGDSRQITQSTNGDGGHDVAPDGTLYFVRNLGSSKFDIFSVAYTASPAKSADRVTNGSDVLGGVSVHPDGTRLLYARAAGAATNLIERALDRDTERVIGDSGDEEPDFFSGGDALVLSRDSFDSDSEIAVTDTDGKLVTRLTDDPEFESSPSVSPLESGDVDLSPFE